jgi:hypothetical protein
MKGDFLKKIDRLLIGLILVGWIGFIYFSSTCLFFLNIVVNIYSCWLINLIYILFLYLFIRRYYLAKTIPHQNIVFNIITSISIVLLSFLISNYFSIIHLMDKPTMAQRLLRFIMAGIQITTTFQKKGLLKFVSTTLQKHPGSQVVFYIN